MLKKKWWKCKIYDHASSFENNHEKYIFYDKQTKWFWLKIWNHAWWYNDVLIPWFYSMHEILKIVFIGFIIMDDESCDFRFSR